MFFILLMFITAKNMPQNFEDPKEQNKPSAIEYFAKEKTKSSLYFFNTKKLAGIIKIPPKQQNKSYADLPGSDPKDREKIIEIFKTMGSHGKVDLLLHYKSHLEKLGKEIEHVHPLKFLGTIFSNTNPDMRPYMDNIYNDYFKWKNFMDGFEPHMEHEYIKKNLYQHLDAFAKEINIPVEYIKPYIDKRDWKGFIKFLIYY